MQNWGTRSTKLVGGGLRNLCVKQYLLCGTSAELGIVPSFISRKERCPPPQSLT